MATRPLQQKGQMPGEDDGHCLLNERIPRRPERDVVQAIRKEMQGFK
jgi:hypothetical protein